MMKIWLDDIRSAPVGYLHTHSVEETKAVVILAENRGETEFLFDLDHDLGAFACEGGDARNFVVWMIETERNTSNYKIAIHTANPVGHEFIASMVERYWEK